MTPEIVTPAGSWLFGSPASSVAASAVAAQSRALPYRGSRSASQPHVCGSSGSGFRLIVTPSLLPV